MCKKKLNRRQTDKQTYLPEKTTHFRELLNQGMTKTIIYCQKYKHSPGTVNRNIPIRVTRSEGNTRVRPSPGGSCQRTATTVYPLLARTSRKDGPAWVNINGALSKLAVSVAFHRDATTELIVPLLITRAADVVSGARRYRHSVVVVAS